MDILSMLTSAIKVNTQNSEKIGHPENTEYYGKCIQLETTPCIS